MLEALLEKFEDVFKPASEEEVKKRPPQVIVFERGDTFELIDLMSNFIQQLGGFTYSLPYSEETTNFKGWVLSFKELSGEDLARIYAESKRELGIETVDAD